MRHKQYKKIFYQAIMLSVFGVELVFARTFKDFIDNDILPVIGMATKILVGAAVVLFFWNLVYISWQNNEGSVEGIKKAGTQIAWGIFIIFVMVSVWGLLEVVRSILRQGL